VLDTQFLKGEGRDPRAIASEYRIAGMEFLQELVKDAAPSFRDFLLHLPSLFHMFLPSASSFSSLSLFFLFFFLFSSFFFLFRSVPLNACGYR